MSKIVLTTNDQSVAQKVQDFAKLLGVEVEVKPEEAKVLTFASSASSNSMTLDQLECEAITKAISSHKGNLSEVAKSLNIGRATLYRKVKQYQIDTKQVRSKKAA